MIIYDDDRILKMQEKLKNTLNPKRYMHTLGVAYTSSAIAMAYGEDNREALVAGLLHDCAKCIPDDTLYEKCLEAGLEVTDSENRMRFLLHAKYGAYLAEKEYGITDENILNAIRFHTTGRENMSLLEKIVYIADFIEPSRNFECLHPLEELRQLVFKDIDKTLVYIIEDLFEFKNYPAAADVMDPNSIMAYNFYRKKI